MSLFRFFSFIFVLLILGILLLLLLFKMAWSFLRKQPSHIVFIYFFRYFNQIEPFKFFNIIIFKLIKLVMVLFMFLKPQLHHWRLRCPFFIESSPSCWFLQLIHDNVMLSNWLIFPFGTCSIDLIPEFKCHFKLKIVILLLACSCDIDGVFCYVHCLVE